MDKKLKIKALVNEVMRTKGFNYDDPIIADVAETVSAMTLAASFKAVFKAVDLTLALRKFK